MVTMPAITIITDPDGTDWALDGLNGFWEAPGKKGFHGTTYQHYRDESPMVAGAFWRGVRATPKELFLPIVIRDPNRDLVLAKRRAIARALSPVRGSGECVIASTWPDGSVRRINARYVDGLEGGEQGPGDWGVTVIKYGLRFIADDPYFYGDEITENYSLAPQTRTELPIPGADTFFEVVSSPLLAAGSVVTNLGDVDSYPIWNFIGPFTQIIAQNATSGKTFTIVHTAATSANTLSLVTEPGESYLVDENGVNRWDKLTAGYQLWPLKSGDNTVNISLTGPTTDSAAILRYRPLYEAD